MSDSNNSGDKKSQGPSGSKRLELKKPVEAGKVRQSFSHGRSKTVKVEVRKKRSFSRDIEAAASAKPGRGAAGETKRKSAPQRGGAAKPAGAAKRQLTESELAARVRAIKSARAAAEEEARRRAAEEEARRRAAEEEARRRAEEEARRKAEEEEARRRAAEQPEEPAPAREEETAAVAAPAEETQPAPVKPAAPRKAAAAPSQDAAPRRKQTPPKPAKPARPTRGAGERRRSNKSMAQLLDDRGERQRSLASMRRRQERERRAARNAGSGEAPAKVYRDVVIPETITVAELANRMAERAVEVVRALMKMGVMVTVNQSIDADTAQLIVEEFGHRPKRVSESDIEDSLIQVEDDPADLEPRPPVVTVMGHVDHGKTSLLDALRHADVAAHEAGGITQHIGAYQVELNGQKITFLDTPGHAAFTAMRARGAKATDIVILVVAADDSVMPQTIEAIRHAKEADVPIVVAINKCDRPDADPNRVRQDLLQHELFVEEMGGDVLSVEVSAIKKQGLDKLLEAVLLQAELLELKANYNCPASGTIIEAKLEQGRGPVATTLVQRGTLRVGDVLVAGDEWGRVRALINDRGERVKEATPSMPVEILGLQATPSAGDEFAVVENEAKAREISEFRHRKRREARAAGAGRGTLEQMFSAIKEGTAKELPVLVKADVQGSVEAIVAACEKLANDEVKVRVVHGAVGAISESDVQLAKASGALILGFNVRANKQARELAEREKTDIRYYSVIYHLTDDLRNMLSGMMKPEMRENFIGTAEILEVFNITKVGKVAGCVVREGVIRRGAGVRLLRDNVVIHEGTLSTLKRFKDEVREVKQGMECGMAFEKYQDLQVGDIIEAFEVQEVAREF